MNLIFKEPDWQYFDGVAGILNDAISHQRNAYTDLFLGPSAKEWYSEFVENKHYSCVVIENGNVVGWGTLRPYRNGRGAFSHIQEVSFYVSYNSHGNGIGTALLKHLEKEALKISGINTLIAILLSDNLPSKSLLLKHDYQVIGEFAELADFGENKVGHLYMSKNIK